MSSLLAHPDAALVTLLAGILLLYLEANRPGWILPGCVGALLALLSVYALGGHALHRPALALIALGISLTLAEIFRPTRNLLAVIGFLALCAGLVTLVVPPARIHPATALVFAAIFCTSTLWLGRIALLARRNKRQSIASASAPRSRRVD